MVNADLKKLRTLAGKYKSSYIISTYVILITASIVSGGIFLLANALHLAPFSAFILAAAACLALTVYPVILVSRRFLRPGDDLKRSIKMLGEGRLDEPLNLDREELFVDIAESVNMAGEQLSDKLQSIVRNTNRLSQVEEELSSLFRPRNAADKYTRDLVCRLKICTSRLKNDLNDFCICEEQKRDRVAR